MVTKKKTTLKKQLSKEMCEAIQSGYPSCVKLLQEKGDNIHGTDDRGRNATYYAIFSGKLNMVKFILNQGAKLMDDPYSGASPLHLAAGEGHLDILIWLHKNYKLDLNVTDQRGMTPIHCANIWAQKECAAYLVENGAKRIGSIRGFASLIQYLKVRVNFLKKEGKEKKILNYTKKIKMLKSFITSVEKSVSKKRPMPRARLEKILSALGLSERDKQFYHFWLKNKQKEIISIYREKGKCPELLKYFWEASFHAWPRFIHEELLKGKLALLSGYERPDLHYKLLCDKAPNIMKDFPDLDRDYYWFFSPTKHPVISIPRETSVLTDDVNYVDKLLEPGFEKQLTIENKFNGNGKIDMITDAWDIISKWERKQYLLNHPEEVE